MTDDEAIAAWLAKHGATKCPTVDLKANDNMHQRLLNGLTAGAAKRGGNKSRSEAGRDLKYAEKRLIDKEQITNQRKVRSGA